VKNLGVNKSFFQAYFFPFYDVFVGANGSDFFLRNGISQNFCLGCKTRIAKFIGYEKSIQHSIGQSIRPHSIIRIHRGYHKKQIIQRKRSIRNSNLLLLHTFKKSRLYFWWSTIDLIGEHKRTKNRTLFQSEFSGFRIIHFGSENIRRKHI